MFKKVLIANRGEIALRINRACRELGVQTVAIFSEADRNSLHVRHADEAFCVGPGPVARSYLNIPNIISTALITGCDAVHPGLRFSCGERALCGDLRRPRPDVHRSETGSDRRDGRQSDGKARDARSRRRDDARHRHFGFGRRSAQRPPSRSGIRCCSKRRPAAAEKACASSTAAKNWSARIASATAEAEASFKDGRVYMEKLIVKPRHIEVQVLGDTFGNVVHLGERDCSVQKPSHQKLIEEAPAPNLTAEGAQRAARHGRPRMPRP